MIVTTAGRTNKEMTAYAEQIAIDLQSSFLVRNDRPIYELHEQYKQDILVVGKNRLVIFPQGTEESFFFHPNSAMFRVKRLMRGEHDPFLQAAQLEKGMTVLDCTLGMASDSIVASYAVGESGQVTGLEGNRYMAYLIEKGLQQWDAGVTEMTEAMQRITVKHTEHLSFLQ